MLKQFGKSGLRGSYSLSTLGLRMPGIRWTVLDLGMKQASAKLVANIQNCEYEDRSGMGK